MKELKQKKCKSCGAMFKPFSSLAKVCSMACSLDYIGTTKQQAEAKANAKRRRDFMANDSGHQKKRAQKAFISIAEYRRRILGKRAGQVQFAERCPVSERACRCEAVWLPQNCFLGTKEDMDDIANAFEKVYQNRDALKPMVRA